MSYYFTQFDRDFPGVSNFGTLFRDMERWFRDMEGRSPEVTGSWPHTQVKNSSEGYEISVELPGLSDKDVRLDVHQGVLTLSGERRVNVPEGFKAVRTERATARFSRSLQLPEDVDQESVAAVMKNGVLSIRLPKRPEVQPKQIAVKAG